MEQGKLQVELSESLRRNRLQLRGDLDELEGDAGAGVLQAGDLKLREQELQNIKRSIDELNDQITGLSSVGT